MTTLWVAGFPVFMIVFMFLASLVIARIDAAIARKAADAGSLAATKKLDELVGKEIRERMEAVLKENAEKGLAVDPWYAVAGTPDKKNGLIRHVIQSNREELIRMVKHYLVKNGAEPHGVITFFADGRVKVEAHAKFRPVLFEEEFRGTMVKGHGTGPTREYGSWLSRKNQPVVIQF